MSDPTKLPKSWKVIPLPNAASINPPKGKIEATLSELAHFVPMACVQVEFSGIDVSTTRPLREVLKGYTSFQEGDVLFAKITPCMENGKLAVVPPLEHRWGFGSTEFHVLRASEIALPKWIAHFLSQASVRRDAQRSMTGSAGQLRVPALWLNEQEIPIPPIAEQARIVAKIEELFSDLDAGVAALKRAKANLKRYRASVLKAAVEGKLTEEWRAKHPAKEPASALLARILKERRQKWEADQLAKFAAAKKEPPKNWKDKYVEPTPPVTMGLPELPDGWCWASVDQLGDVQLGRQRSPKNRSDEFPTKYIRAANLTENGLDLSDVMDMEFQPHELETYRLHPGDVLLSEASGSPDQVGKPVVWSGEIEDCCFQNTVIRLRPVGMPSDYALTVFRHYYRSKLFAKVSAGVGINHLSAGKFSVLPFPLSPLTEQAQIVTEVDEHLSLIAVAEMQIEHSLLRASRLRQSILKQAFEGKLVPQDPKDEPASVLLERLRASLSHDEANGLAATSKRTRAKIKESAVAPPHPDSSPPVKPKPTGGIT